MFIDKRVCKALLVAGTGLAFTSILSAQPPQTNPPQTNPPQNRLPDTDVIAPRPGQPTTIPGTSPDSPTIPNFDGNQPADSGTGINSSGFSFTGSPLADYSNRSSSLLNGFATNPFDASRSFSAIDAGRIAQQNAISTPEILDTIPGVLVQRTNLGGGSFVIRGRNGNQNLIMIDGIPINDAGWRFGNVQYLNYIDPGVIDRVEVIRGPASTLYGSGALGGALNIMTKNRGNFVQDRLGWDGMITHNFSTAVQGNYGRVEMGGQLQNFGVYAGGSYQSLNNVFSGQGVSYPERAVGYDQLAGDIRLDWQLNSHWSATFVYQHFFQNDVPRTDRFPLAAVDPTRFENRPTYADQERDFGYFRLNYENCEGLINGMQLTFALQRRHEIERELRLAERVAGNLVNMRTRLRLADEEINYGGVDWRGRTDFSQYHHLTYGASFWLHVADASRWQQQSAAVGGPVEGLPATMITPTIPSNGRYDEFGVFIMDTIEVTERWNVNFGGRYSNINARGTARLLSANPPPVDFNVSFQDWTGEVGTVYKLSKNLNWFGNISEGFRAPNLEDLGANERATGIGADNGNTALQPERSTNFETGLKYRNELFAFSGAWYHTNLESMIVRTLAPNGTVTRGNTRGYIEGVEIEGALLLTENLSLFGIGSKTLGSDEIRNEPLRVPPAQFIGGVRWNFCSPGGRAIFVETFTELTGKQGRIGEFDRRDIRVPLGGTPGWQTLNIRTGIDFKRFGQMTLGVYNIFDQNYRVHGSGLDAPGVEFRGGYQVKF